MSKNFEFINGLIEMLIDPLMMRIVPRLKKEPLIVVKELQMPPERIIGQTEALRLFGLSYRTFVEDILPNISKVRRFGNSKIKDRNGNERVMERIEFTYGDFKQALKMYQQSWD